MEKIRHSDTVVYANPCLARLGHVIPTLYMYMYVPIAFHDYHRKLLTGSQRQQTLPW